MTSSDRWLLAGAVALAMLPLFLGFSGQDVFSGSDGQAQSLVETLRPDYQPWAAPLWEPPSSEVASGLFALQAALGAGVLGYCLGRRDRRRRDDGVADAQD